jgi:hypothetical protein
LCPFDTLFQAILEVLIFASALEGGRNGGSDHLGDRTILNRRNRFQHLGLVC